MKKSALKEPPSSVAVDVQELSVTYPASKQKNLCPAQNAVITSVKSLSDLIPMSSGEKLILEKVTSKYHMRITSYYWSLIKNTCNPSDPIRRQCVPNVKELQNNSHESIDPLGEEEKSVTPFLVHRYPNRVLLLTTSKCFMYCRHCTRKRLWASDISDISADEIKKAVSYINSQPKIREVIVSGGDPLTLSNCKIDSILSALSECKNIEAIRIGTRAPVVLPERINDGLCKILEKYQKLWINVQFNHPWEITPASETACRKIQKCGIPINNQSVLLKGINDNPIIMKKLCEKLQAIRVRPYYLFQCDPVVGACHFRTSLFKGIEIIEKMRGHTGGLCVPTFVVDGTNGKGKVPIAPNYVLSTTENEITLRNYNNEIFKYHIPG
ncbi:MAG: KamA family radical SAM protein [Candidatus Omnitrophota bacterium]